jgi:hypothetical protein
MITTPSQNYREIIMISILSELRVWTPENTAQNRDRKASPFKKAEVLHRKSNDIDAMILPHGRLDSKQMRMLRRSVALKHGASKLNQQGIAQVSKAVVPVKGRVGSRVSPDRPFLGPKKG